MPLTRRYEPEHPPDEATYFGLDYSFVIPAGMIITSATLEILTNTNPPQPSSDWSKGPVEIASRAVYCWLSGGTPGTDYQLRWVATDSQGNRWPRTTLVLCADTS